MTWTGAVACLGGRWKDRVLQWHLLRWVLEQEGKGHPQKGAVPTLCTSPAASATRFVLPLVLAQKEDTSILRPCDSGRLNQLGWSPLFFPLNPTQGSRAHCCVQSILAERAELRMSALARFLLGNSLKQDCTCPHHGARCGSY